MQNTEIKLDNDTMQFFSGLLDETANIARPYVRNARMGTLEITDKNSSKTAGAEQRKDLDPFSEADTKIQEHIFNKVTKRYPNVLFVGEEEDDRIIQHNAKIDKTSSPQLRFVVDPLDGSKPFAIGQANWAVTNFALQQKNDKGEWETRISGTYAPERGMAVLADENGVKFRSEVNHFADKEFHDITELRPNPQSSTKSVPDSTDLKGVQIDLRLVNNDEVQSKIWRDLQDKKMTVRNAGPLVATTLDLLTVRPEKAAIVAGNPGGEWDWRAAEHFMKKAGFTTGFETVEGAGKDGKDYKVFIAAGTPQLYNYIKGNLERNLEQHKKNASRQV